MCIPQACIIIGVVVATAVTSGRRCAHYGKLLYTYYTRVSTTHYITSFTYRISYNVPDFCIRYNILLLCRELGRYIKIREYYNILILMYVDYTNSWLYYYYYDKRKQFEQFVFACTREVTKPDLFNIYFIL